MMTAYALAVIVASSCAKHVDDVLAFQQLALEASAGSPQGLDKLSRKHAYQLMYGMFLLPLIRERRDDGLPVRMMEIGLGCVRGFADSPPTLKKSVHVWDRLLDRDGDHLVVAEFKRDCAADWHARGIIPPRVQVVTGDQADAADVRRWARETGGRFDAIVDDGGHAPHMILTAFTELWPHVAPGGLYFVEDLEVNRKAQERLSRLSGLDGGAAVGTKQRAQLEASLRDPALLANQTCFVDVIDDWIDQLLTPNAKHRVVHRIPEGVRYIFCQNHACVIAKCKEDDVAKCSGPHRTRSRARRAA